METWVRYVHLCPMWRKQRGIRKAQYRYIRDICPSVAVCMYIFRNMFFHSRVYVWHLLYFALPFQRRLALWTQMRWQCLCRVHRISSKKRLKTVGMLHDNGSWFCNQHHSTVFIFSILHGKQQLPRVWSICHES